MIDSKMEDKADKMLREGSSVTKKSALLSQIINFY